MSSEAARNRFFDNMERELMMDEAARVSLDTTNDGALDVDFAITESGRTTVNMLTTSERTMEYTISESCRTQDTSMWTESERDMLVKTLVTNSERSSGAGDGNNGQSTTTTEGKHKVSRSIPVPKPPPSSAPSSLLQQQQQSVNQGTNSEPSSHGSSGSAFLRSVLNPTASTFGNSQLSHTPPLGTSVEAARFGKRARSGSVSGRLRSASEYLEEKGLLDRQTKGILKDLIIIGDEDLQRALDRYEEGDATQLEQMIRSGALQNRLPSDLNLLEDFNLDFLTVSDGDVASAVDTSRNIEALQPAVAATATMHTASGIDSSSANGAASRLSNTAATYHDDGIGELELGFDVSDDYNMLSSALHQSQPPTYASSSRDASAAASPSDSNTDGIDEYERRMRSNSLYSALLDPTGDRGPPRALSNGGNQNDAADGQKYQQWTDPSCGAGEGMIRAATVQQGIEIRKPQHRSASAPSLQLGGIGASLAAEQKQQQKKKNNSTKDKTARKSKKEEEAAVEEHVSGCGRPRTLSDPNLRTSLDSDGLMKVERPDGWVGAYSPESRKVRIGRFLEKRNKRVWSKSIKYDVRKNFADSRLRVKGRFVRKEDELLMRELMSLT